MTTTEKEKQFLKRWTAYSNNESKRVDNLRMEMIRALNKKENCDNFLIIALAVCVGTATIILAMVGII